MSDKVFNLRFLLEKEKLKPDGSNFSDWYRNVRIVLRNEKKELVMTVPPMRVPANNANPDVVALYEADIEKQVEVQCLLVSLMDSELQKRFEFRSPYETIEELKKMFQEQTRINVYNMIKGMVSTKMTEGSSVSAHLFKMIGYVQELEKMEIPLDNVIATDLILNSLPASYSDFILHYHMMGMDKSLQELQGMLKTAEADKKCNNKQVLFIRGGKKVNKGQGKSKWKGKKGKGKGVKTFVKNEGGPKAKTFTGAECYYCKGKGHWKRNCRKYLADLKSGASTSGANVVVINPVSTQASN